MPRGLLVLLVLVAAVAGGLMGLRAGPEVWFALEDFGLVATPTCNDVFGGTVDAICAQPRSMAVVALATAALCTGVAGFMAWHLLRRTLPPLPGTTRPSGG